MKKILLIALSLFLAEASLNDANAEVCLDYWLKGPAACKQKKKEKPISVHIKGSIKGRFPKAERDSERLKYEEELNIKIDKFLENYGKPPREFVAFHLDPTMENAIKWVKKFNTDHERTMKVAVAWKQAEEIFEEYRDTGEVTLPASSGVTESQVKYIKEVLDSDPTDLPPVKGFGIDVEGKWDEDRLGRNYARLTYKEKTKAYGNAVSRLSNTGGSSSFSLKALEEKMARQSKTAGKSEQTLSGKMYPLEISYYYSANCPYCAKYKPQLKDAIEKIGKKNIKLTCVDMTPGRKNKSIVEDLDCKWRPIMSGEMKEYGIKRTPSLLVKRNNSKGLELLENYHSSKSLIRYFKKGK